MKKSFQDMFETNARGKIVLPNVKKIFLPDPGYEMMDADLGGADAWTYFSDSNCIKGLDFLHNPYKYHPSGKLYAWVASEHLQRDVGVDDPEYKFYKGSHHGVWYGMAVRKLAITINCSVGKAGELLEFYNYLYPEKDLWHRRLISEVNARGWLENIFGRRAWFINTNDPTRKNQMFSFKAQSTTSDVINRGWVNIRRNIRFSELESGKGILFPRNHPDILAQVHDSLLMQYPIPVAEEVRPLIMNEMLIPLPYAKPVRIPADFKVSTVSYGDCKKLPSKV
jgi:DNA polymerase-1